ncbi:MAG: SMP-30/gluconolactonase/LRE family protein [Rhodopirellula sp.]|nr:SMP-30/gluconolactonase/LRE family protein [Rhodopirellula sp.]
MKIHQQPSDTRRPAITRRDAVTQIITATASVALFDRVANAAGVADQYAGLESSRYLSDLKVLATVKDDKVFTEGPAADAHGNLYFTNVPADRILKWDGQALTVFRENSNAANGLYFEPDGSLLACEGGAKRVTRTNMKTGEVKVLADSYNGFPLASPNDLCSDVAGRIYFSSRPGVEDPAKGNVNAVYRIDPDGSLTQLLKWPDIHMPNGIVISPDNRTLYLIEAHPDADRNRNILAFDLATDGSLSRRRTLINFYPGRSGDGMCIDSQGNLYVAAGLHATRKTSETLDTRPGIHVVSPAGKLLGFLETPEDTITNCTFGGADLKTLFVACGTKLVSMRTTIPGKATYRPQH